jgi:hypothetical protein
MRAAFGAWLALWAAVAVAADAHVTVYAFGANDKEEAARVSEALGKLDGVSQVTVSDVSGEGARLDVTLAQGDGKALAQKMDDAAALPLRVEQSTADRVLARMGPSKKARVPFRVSAFEDKSKDKSLADPARLAADSTKLLLENAPFLVAAPNPDDALLIFTGRLSKDDKGLVYELRILRAKSGEISYGKGKGDGGLSETLQMLVKALPQRLAELESAHFQKDAALMALPRAMDRAKRGLPLRLVKVEGGIDPSQPAHYATDPVVTVWLEDQSGKAITGAVAHASLEGLSTASKDSGPLTLKPGAPAKIPVLASLDGDRLGKTPNPGVASLKVDVTFKQGDLDRTASFVVPVPVGAKP